MPARKEKAGMMMGLSRPKEKRKKEREKLVVHFL
jgi:hypothetical protein